MATVGDILYRAGRALGYLGRSEVMGAQDATDALACFNEMLDSWTNETLAAYVTLQRSFTLTANTQTYTIGSGGVVNTARPWAITSAFLRDSNNNDYGMSIYTRQQWDSIGTKYITSQIPNTLFYDAQYPLGVINIFPVPLLPYTLFYNSVLNQVTYSLLTSDVELPQGYLAAYVFNLALKLQSYGFPCLLNDRDYIRLVENAAEAKANIKRANNKPDPARYDPAVVSRSYATYNIYMDGFPRQ
jgi:hypothetical protein